MVTQALREAAVKARAKTEALAAGLGGCLGKVLLVEEGDSGVHPPDARDVSDDAREAAPPTPVEPGIAP